MYLKYLLFLVLVLAGGLWVYFSFGPVQSLKFVVSEKMYMSAAGLAEEKHAKAESLFDQDVHNVASGKKDLAGLGELDKALAEEKAQVEKTAKIGEFQSSLSLSRDLGKVAGAVSYVDNLREDAFSSWEKAMITWKKVRNLVIRFEATREQIATTSRTWKTEGVSEESVDNMKMSLDEMLALKQDVDELTKEDSLTKELVDFFTAAFADFSAMRQTIAVIENPTEAKGDQLVAGWESSVKGVKTIDGQMLLSDWVEVKLVPDIQKAAELFAREKEARQAWTSQN